MRRRALALVEEGASLRAVSLSTGISRAALREWRDDPGQALRASRSCPRCAEKPGLPERPASYAYLLGPYLGDGCISVGGAPAKKVLKLRVACCDAWPGLVAECARAMETAWPDSKAMFRQCQGCTEVFSYSRHWPCLFPQHGPGKKHLRRIALEPWQDVIVREFPGELARGLFHSDGWRGLNRVRRVLADGEQWYEYPRYQFTNKSADIQALCGAALDRLGVAWRLVLPARHDLGRETARRRAAG